MSINGPQRSAYSTYHPPHKKTDKTSYVWIKVGDRFQAAECKELLSLGSRISNFAKRRWIKTQIEVYEGGSFLKKDVYLKLNQQFDPRLQSVYISHVQNNDTHNATSNPSDEVVISKSPVTVPLSPSQIVLQKYQNEGLAIRSVSGLDSINYELSEGLKSEWTCASFIKEGIPIERYSMVDSETDVYFLYDTEKLNLQAAYKIDAYTSKEHFRPVIESGKFKFKSHILRGLDLTDISKTPSAADSNFTTVRLKVEKMWEKVSKSMPGPKKYEARLGEKKILKWNEIIVQQTEEKKRNEAIIGFGIGPSVSADNRVEIIKRVRTFRPGLPCFEYVDAAGELKSVTT